MKKWCLILLIVLTIPSALSLSVTLDSPTTGNTSANIPINFICSATDPTYSINSIALYTDISGTWAATSTHAGSETSYTFTTTASPGTYKWNCLATNSNSDTAYAVTNNTITISNLAFSGSIPNQTINEDSSSTAFDLGTYFTSATYYTVSGNSSINVSINSNNEVILSSTNNWTGSENIIFTGHSTATVSSNTILVTINNINDSPYLLTTIPNQTTKINTPFTLDLSNYFKDPDNNNLTYTITSTYFTLTSSLNNVNLTPTNSWSGSESVYITASDGTLAVNSNTFTITIGSSKIESYTPSANPTINLGESQTFTITSSETVTWYINDEPQSTDSSFTYTPENEGTYTIKAVVGDEEKSWTLTVNSPLFDEEVESIITTSQPSSVCGNGIKESDETCTTCLLDVPCPQGYICTEGVCQQKKSLTKSILTLTIITLFIIITAILIYYFTSLKNKGKNQPTTFQYRPITARPPADYTDFYKGQK